jgi:hypothetical protein
MVILGLALGCLVLVMVGLWFGLPRLLTEETTELYDREQLL